MKKPHQPPRSADVAQISLVRLLTIIASDVTSPLAQGEYLHFDDLRHRKPPEGFSLVEWWYAIKFAREAMHKRSPMVDEFGKLFRYAIVDPIPELLHEIDLGAGGMIELPDQITNPNTRDRYYINSLIEEATTSSQIEGATTTGPVAKEMIRTGRPPRDESEKMILNNFRAMQRIGEMKKDKLSREMVFELHRILTEGTLKNESAAGRFRTPDEDVVVMDIDDAPVHFPPSAESLTSRMESM